MQNDQRSISLLEERLFVFLFLLLGLIGFAIALKYEGYSVTTDRDLHFGLTLEQGSSFLGAHAGTSGRIPGGSYFLLLHALLKFGNSPGFILSMIRLGYLLAVVFLALTVRKYYGGIAAAVAFAVCLVSIETNAMLSSIWNSAFATPFAILATLFFIRGLHDSWSQNLVWIALFLGLATQIHFVAGALFVCFFGAYCVAPVRVRRKDVFISMFILFLLYSPYLCALLLKWIPSSSVKTFSTYGARLLNVNYMSDVRHCMIRRFLGLDPQVLVRLQTPLLVYGIVLGLSTLTVCYSALRLKAARGIVLCFLIGILIAFFGIPNCEGHYLFYLTPLAAVIIGIAVQFTLQNKLLLRAYLLLVFLSLVTQALELNPRVSASTAAEFKVEELNTIHNELYHRYGLRGSDFETKVAVVRVGALGDWHHPDSASSQCSYLTRQLPGLPSGRAPCVLVLRCAGRCFRVNSKFKMPKIDQQQYPDFQILDQSEDGPLVFLSYRLPNHNCLKNLANNYLRLPEEIAPYPTNSFPGEISIALGLEKRIPFVLHIQDNDDRLSVTLHSSRLRGYGEYGSTSLDSPLAIFENTATGEILAVPIFEGELGIGLLLAPWTSRPFALNAGKYRIYLETGRVVWRDFQSDFQTRTLVSENFFVLPKVSAKVGVRH